MDRTRDFPSTTLFSCWFDISFQRGESPFNRQLGTSLAHDSTLHGISTKQIAYGKNNRLP